MIPLSNLQKAEIGQLARQAWQAWEGREAFIESNELSVSDCFAAWRHVEQGKACGKQSLKACTSEEDYERLRAHFLALAGREGPAARALVRQATNPERIARYKLDEALKAAGFDENYAREICRIQFRCSLRNATARQLWCLVFTVRNRGRKVATPLRSEVQS